MMKEPTRSLKAVADPREIAPNPVTSTAARRVAGIGQERRSSTCAKTEWNGVDLSRASAQKMRPTVKKVPITQIMMDRKMMRRRPKVPPLLPVA